MKKENELNLPEKESLLYIGNDTYWFTSFKKYIMTKLPEMEITHIEVENPQKVQEIIYQILYNQPRIIMVDISQHTKDTLHLTRLLKNTNFYFKSIVISLMDSTLKDEYLYNAIMSRADLCQFKIDDYVSITNNIIALGHSEKLEEHGLAFANLEDEISISYPCKIGYVEKDYISIETNLNFKESEEYFFKSFLQEEELSPFTGVECVETSQQNLYYPYKNRVKLKIQYLNPVEVSEERKDDKEYLAELETERQKKIKNKRELLEEWIERKVRSCFPKPTKILIVDRSLTIYRNQKLSDTYRFAIRCQPFLIDMKKEIEKVWPNIIYFQIDRLTSEQLAELDDGYKEHLNTSTKLEQLINTVTKIEDYNPIIVCFNTSHEQAQNLRSKYSYDNIINYAEEISNELVIQMSELFSSKNDKNGPSPEKFFVPDKRDIKAYGEVQIPIKLLGWSECDIYFEAPLEFPPLTTLHFDHKTSFFVTVAEMPKHSPYQKAQYAVIHGADETDIMEIRRYVNEVFFREKQKAKEEELKQFEQAKVDYVIAKEKEEAERKAAEEEQEGGDPLDKEGSEEDDQGDDSSDTIEKIDNSNNGPTGDGEIQDGAESSEPITEEVQEKIQEEAKGA